MERKRRIRGRENFGILFPHTHTLLRRGGQCKFKPAVCFLRSHTKQKPTLAYICDHACMVKYF